MSSEVLSFEFHNNHGKNISLSEDRCTAKRSASYNQAMVVSHRPLPRNQLFEVSHGIKVGVGFVVRYLHRRYAIHC